jgi:hypothetical protein
MKTVTKATLKKVVVSGNLKKRDRVPIHMPHSSGELVRAELESRIPTDAKCFKKLNFKKLKMTGEAQP